MILFIGFYPTKSHHKEETIWRRKAQKRKLGITDLLLEKQKMPLWQYHHGTFCRWKKDFDEKFSREFSVISVLLPCKSTEMKGTNDCFGEVNGRKDDKQSPYTLARKRKLVNYQLVTKYFAKWRKSGASTSLLLIFRFSGAEKCQFTRQWRNKWFTTPYSRIHEKKHILCISTFSPHVSF